MNTFLSCSFLSIEWVKDLHESGNEIPSFDEIKNYRGERGIDLLVIWCTYFFPSVSGTCSFKACADVSRLSKFFSTSDEAFAVTVVENFYERWKVEGKMKAEGKETDGIRMPTPKWTESMGSVGVRNKGGWSNEGLKQFNENTTDIVALRETQNSVKLEIDYLKKMKGESGKNKRGNGDGYKRKSEEVVTIDDFSPVQDIGKKKPMDGKKARREKDDLRALLEQRYHEKKQMPDDDDDDKEEEIIEHENDGGGSEEDSDDDK
jgi:hypothetical protein